MDAAKFEIENSNKSESWLFIILGENQKQLVVEVMFNRIEEAEVCDATEAS